jgi:hypothetical protein
VGYWPGFWNIFEFVEIFLKKIKFLPASLKCH